MLLWRESLAMLSQGLTRDEASNVLVVAGRSLLAARNEEQTDSQPVWADGNAPNDEELLYGGRYIGAALDRVDALSTEGVALGGILRITHHDILAAETTPQGELTQEAQIAAAGMRAANEFIIAARQKVLGDV